MHHPQMQMHIWNTDRQFQKYLWLYGVYHEGNNRSKRQEWNKMFMPVTRSEFKMNGS